MVSIGVIGLWVVAPMTCKGAIEATDRALAFAKADKTYNPDDLDVVAHATARAIKACRGTVSSDEFDMIAGFHRQAENLRQDQKINQLGKEVDQIIADERKKLALRCHHYDHFISHLDDCRRVGVNSPDD
jgi:hypothetical protein